MSEVPLTLGSVHRRPRAQQERCSNCSLVAYADITVSLPYGKTVLAALSNVGRGCAARLGRTSFAQVVVEAMDN